MLSSLLSRLVVLGTLGFHSISKTPKRTMFLISGALSLIIVSLFGTLSRDYRLDDALIYYRYVQNFLDGNGLVYNRGERFNALTSPFYTYLSIPAASLFGSVETSQTFLGASFLFLAAIATAALWYRELSGITLFFLPLLIVSSRFFYATFGLETTLFLFLLVCALHFFEREKVTALGIVAALLLLTRGESCILVAVLLFFHWKQHRALPPARAFALPAIMLTVYAIGNYAYYGSVLPNTLAAKIYHGRSGLWESPFWDYWPNFIRVRYHLQYYFGHNVVHFLLIIGLATTGGIVYAKQRRVLITTLFMAGYTAFYLVLRIPHYPWYYAVYYLFGYTFMILALQKILAHTRARTERRQTMTTGVAVGLVCLLVLATQLIFSYRSLKENPPYGSYKEIGLWIKGNTDSSATISCVEIGLLGWYSRRYVVDILGLVNPFNAELVGEKRFDAWLSYYEPDYVLVHDPMWPHEQGMRKAIELKLYVPRTDFPFPDYVLLSRNMAKRQVSGG